MCEPTFANRIRWVLRRVESRPSVSHRTLLCCAFQILNRANAHKVPTCASSEAVRYPIFRFLQCVSMVMNSAASEVSYARVFIDFAAVTSSLSAEHNHIKSPDVLRLKSAGVEFSSVLNVISLRIPLRVMPRPREFPFTLRRSAFRVLDSAKPHKESTCALCTVIRY